MMKNYYASQWIHSQPQLLKLKINHMYRQSGFTEPPLTPTAAEHTVKHIQSESKHSYHFVKMNSFICNRYSDTW